MTLAGSVLHKSQPSVDACCCPAGLEQYARIDRDDVVALIRHTSWLEGLLARNFREMPSLGAPMMFYEGERNGKQGARPCYESIKH